MLGENTSLVSNTDYISSKETRKRIDAGKIREVGKTKTNTEVLIDMQPDLIVGFGLNKAIPLLDILQKSGLKVMFNGD
jgi:iron complex transport system substrate-binding protein